VIWSKAGAVLPPGSVSRRLQKAIGVSSSCYRSESECGFLG